MWERADNMSIFNNFHDIFTGPWLRWMGLIVESPSCKAMQKGGDKHNTYARACLEIEDPSFQTPASL